MSQKDKNAKKILIFCKSSYICNARIRHASRKAAYQGGTFILYRHAVLDTPDLIAQMKSKGLTILNEVNASKFLENVSYFRLAAYLRPMEMDAGHNYKPGSTFENGILLYEFDSQLRHLIFKAIQKIEISLRARIINRFSLKHGAMWFLNSDLASITSQIICQL